MRITVGALRRIIKEEAAQLREVGELTYWYHPVGMDNDGNGGPPSLSDPGWIKVRARDGNEAVTKLPAQARAKIRKAMRQDGTADVDEFMSDTSGWGVGFTLAVEEHGELVDIAP